MRPAWLLFAPFLSHGTVNALSLHILKSIARGGLFDHAGGGFRAIRLHIHRWRYALQFPNLYRTGQIRWNNRVLHLCISAKQPTYILGKFLNHWGLQIFQKAQLRSIVNSLKCYRDNSQNHLIV